MVSVVWWWCGLYIIGEVCICFLLYGSGGVVVYTFIPVVVWYTYIDR